MRNKIGIALFVLYFIQFLVPLKISYLENLQGIELYKKWTGLILFVIILAQWLLSLLRYNNSLTAERKKTFIDIHKWIGVFLPLAFYIHSTDFGFAILLFLSIVFFLNVGIAFLNTDTLIEKYPKAYNWWLALHILFSVLVVAVSIVHIWTVLIYN